MDRRSSIGQAGSGGVRSKTGARLDPMPFESPTTFTPKAAELWTAIPADIRKRLLSNVWCSHCRREVTIRNFAGAVKADDLLLVGTCSECRGDVARVVAVG